MDIIDTIQADQIEIGDTILVDNEEVEVIGIVETDDPDAVTIKGHSLSTGAVDEIELPYDYTVSLLGY